MFSPTQSLMSTPSRRSAYTTSGCDEIAITKLSELEAFAEVFKKKRIKFGFTQGDVGIALGRRYGTDFSQTTISRFEALNLSFKNMCKLRPLLQEWLADVEITIGRGTTVAVHKKTVQNRYRNSIPQIDPPEPPSTPTIPPINVSSSPPTPEQHVTRRRKRTFIDMNQKNTLETFFALDSHPDHDRINDIASYMDLDRDVVRVWFGNTRQKKMRITVDEPVEGEVVEPSVSPPPVFSNISTIDALEQMIQEAVREALASNGNIEGTSATTPEAPSEDL